MENWSAAVKVHTNCISLFYLEAMTYVFARFRHFVGRVFFNTGLSKIGRLGCMNSSLC